MNPSTMQISYEHFSTKQGKTD